MSPSPSVSNHDDSGTPTVHDCAEPFEAPTPQKKLAGHGFTVAALDPVGQK
jgi:hypothetical protein